MPIAHPIIVLGLVTVGVMVAYNIYQVNKLVDKGSL